jgi:hypothetical protein
MKNMMRPDPFELAGRPFDPQQPNEYGSQWLGPIQYDATGWPYLLFKDYYGHNCYVKLSSIAHCSKPGASALWIGCIEDDEQMHLVRGQVQTLVDALTYWLSTGELPEAGK